MKILISIVLTLSLVFAQEKQAPQIEIVESIPVETVLDNPDIRNASEVWLEMIKSANTSLDIEQFYVSDQKGEPLEDILHAVIQAGERGVKVRLIADSRMYKTYPATVDSIGKKKNIESRVIDFGKYGGGIQHAKFFIVDGEEVFFGSQNFDWRALKHIHELGIRLRHKDAVQVYQDVFNLDWQLAGNFESARLKAPVFPKQYSVPYTLIQAQGDTVIFTPTCSPKGYISDTTLWDETNIVNLIAEAKEEVCLQFLSYSVLARDKSYYSVIQDAIKQAAARGVKVKLIVSDWEKDHPAVDSLQSLSQVPNIELKYSNIPEWSGGYVSFARVEHCKYIVVDGKEFWLGTSNCEKSYFYSTRNVGIIVKSQALGKQLHDIFMKGWNGPYMEPIKMGVEYTPREHGDRK